MARVTPLTETAAPAEARELLEEQKRTHGRVTNMKRTLAHSPTALRIFMGWYDLHREVVAILGARATMVFVHAISSQTSCLICSTFFRRWLVESGADPDRLQLTEAEQALAEFGRQLARDANAVSDQLFERLRGFLQPAQLVTLTALGGLMLATNVFNNALRVDLDEYLLPYRRPEPARTKP